MKLSAKSMALAVIGPLALLAAACGSSGGDTAQTTTTDAAATETTSSASESGAEPTTSATSSSDSSSPTESPIGDLLGIPITDSDAMDEYFGQLQRDAEVKISECMLGQGFQYKPIDYSAIGGLATGIDEDSREFVEQYGFGVSSNPFEESFEAFQGFEDPNEEYLSSLSEGESDAYQQALNGDFPESPDDFEEGFQPGGCQGTAYEEVFSFGAVFDEFGDEFEEIEQAFEADSRIVAAKAGWGACMSEAGYNFTDIDDAQADFERRYGAIVNDPNAYDDDGAASDESLTVESSTGETEDAFTFGPRTLRPDFQQRVDALAEEERATALAGWDCNEPLRDIEADIQVEYEQRFVDQHGPAIREALAG